MSGMLYGFIKRRTFQKVSFESEARQPHTKNHYMSNGKIESPTGYFYALRAMTAWEVFSHETGKKVGTIYATMQYLPYRSIGLTVLELQELTDLLRLVTQATTVNQQP